MTNENKTPDHYHQAVISKVALWFSVLEAVDGAHSCWAFESALCSMLASFVDGVGEVTGSAQAGMETTSNENKTRSILLNYHIRTGN